MKKVNKFLREFRKFKCIPPEDFGTRFVADSNAHSISFETEVVYSDYWDLSIVKHHGKYVVTITRFQDNDISYEKSWVTSKDAVIEKLINHEIWEADKFCVKNKHMEDLEWKVDTRETDV